LGFSLPTGAFDTFGASLGDAHAERTLKDDRAVNRLAVIFAAVTRGFRIGLEALEDPLERFQESGTIRVRSVRVLQRLRQEASASETGSIDRLEPANDSLCPSAIILGKMLPHGVDAESARDQSELFRVALQP